MSHLLPDCGSQCERILEPTDVQEGLIAAEGLHHRRVLQQYAVHTLAGVLVLIKLHGILGVSALPGIRPNMKTCQCWLETNRYKISPSVQTKAICLYSEMKQGAHLVRQHEQAGAKRFRL